jgi:hypothetical protein
LEIITLSWRERSSSDCILSVILIRITPKNIPSPIPTLQHLHFQSQALTMALNALQQQFDQYMIDVIGVNQLELARV